MAVNYPIALQQTRMDAVDAAINSGVGTAVLEIGTAAMAVTLVSINLQNPAFGAASAADPSVITLQGVTLSGVASNTGTAAAAQIKDRDGNVVVSGLTVGTSATDVILDNTSVNSGQTVNITAGTLTHS